MDVTRSNFEELLPQIKQDIDNATFITVDAEFTGLSASTEPTPYDSISEFYSKTKTNSKDFLLIQLGVCAFRYESLTKSYKYSCYNFYVFPRPHSRQATDFRFLCQSSSIDFLAAQGFDFNKLFRDGVPYLTKDEEVRLREQLQEKIKSRESANGNKNVDQNLIPIPDNDKEFIEQTCTKVKDFLKSDDDELILDRCNSFLRRLLYQELDKRFKDQLFIESRTMDNRNIVLVIQKTLTPEELALKESQRREREEKELTESVGLSKVLQHIATCDKLIVGHNMLLDVMHIMKQFFGSLPSDYCDFKELAHGIFPRLLDTKVLSSSDPFKDKINSSVLGHLLATLSEEPFVVPTVEQEREGVGYCNTEGKEHEAGYDAFITGQCLLSMCSYLQNDVWNGECDIISIHMNKIFNMRLQDVPYLNLVGKDVKPQRDHVFHATFPKEWKNSDIIQLFSPYGSVQVSWINDSSAFVALHRKENTQLAIAAFTNIKSSDYVIIPYRQYKMESHCHSKTTYQKSYESMEEENASLVNVGSERKRRLTSESKSKDQPGASTMDKHGPSAKVPRESSNIALDLSDHKNLTKSTSGVFNVSEDWN